ncbi:hypothetical protein [Phyllobacterium endophyticum]|uniref:hypothetical protein n=1 Tax=Phyllobacterium endophyticum TaxID=1149773 RepID=UPI0011CC57E7|nr:hypothetical protein [Phyllobacterium endophyticum]TXR46617.1 hypothetical protein FVA77_24155 [Phyllobacterium endophyticum]
MNGGTVDEVEIPGEPTLTRSMVPSVLVRLPVEAGTHRSKNIVSGLLLVFLGAPSLSLAILLAPAAFGAALGNQHFIASIPMWLFLLFISVAMTGVALTCIADAVRKASVLILDAEGFTDARSGAHVKWPEIKRATLLFTRSGIGSVDLHLRQATTAWQNPFRIGVLGFRSRPKPDHLIVSVAFLDVRPHVLAFTILALTRRHGGEAVTKTSFVDLGLSPITPSSL